jgi:hypothetical protein
VSSETDKRNSGDYQRAVGELVQREVIYGVSGLVYQIGRENEDWFHLFVQDDWQTPAREAIAGLSPEKLASFLEEHDCPLEEENTPATLASACLRHLESAGSWQDFCQAHDLEPQSTEIYEHWIVSDWLAAQLEERGEFIERDFYGLTLWGRACTGQAILLDGVICAIYDDLHKEDEPPPDEKPQGDQRAQRIAQQNDRFRADFYIPSFGVPSVPGQVFCTSGIGSLSPETQICIWAEVSTFSDFSEANDPHAERDFGAFTMESVDEKIFWKIDYYADKSCTAGSEDPADTARTFRILTIMLASEY